MPQFIGFYSVPLVCAAVPQIGCGYLAKPVLARLEGEPAIKRAWLHRHGDVIAIEWRHRLDPVQQISLLRTATGGGDIVAIPAAHAPELFAKFPNPHYWYSRETLDQLSGEEAHVIAARLLLRLSREGVPLPDGAALQCELACALRDVLVEERDAPLDILLAKMAAMARAVLLQRLGSGARLRLERWLTTATLLPEGAGRAGAAAPCRED